MHMRKGATLRYKAISKGKIESLYLQYYPPLTGKDGKTCWYEFLHMERYKSPENDVERRYNHDVEELAEAIRCERYLMLVRKDYPFSCYTGLRRSDILQLQWKSFVRSRKEGSMHIIIKKTKVEVRLPLSNKAMRIIGNPKQKGRIFPSLTVSILNEQIPKLIRQAGIRKCITFHCFRYTFAQMLLDRGVDIYTIAHLLGHKQVSSTQCYVRPSDKLCQQAIKLLDK